MEKYELLKYAYENYPKGTKFKQMRSGKVIDSSGIFNLNVYETWFNISDSNKGHFVYESNSEKWAEIVSEQPQKIAVRIDNEKELTSLLVFLYESDKEWMGEKEKSEKYAYRMVKQKSHVICVSEKGEIVNYQVRDYTVIPFSDFAKEHNIKLPLIKSEDGVWLYEGDSYFRAYLEKGKWVYNGEWEYLKKDHYGIEYPEEFKLFSNHKSALDWIEAQKHTFPLINETKKEIVAEYEIEFNEKSSVLITKDNVKFNGSEFDLTQLEVLAIVSKFKSLQ